MPFLMIFLDFAVVEGSIASITGMPLLALDFCFWYTTKYSLIICGRECFVLASAMCVEVSILFNYLFMYVEVSILYFNCLFMCMMKTWFAYNHKHMATCVFTPVIPFFCVCVCASVLKQLIRTCTLLSQFLR